MQILTCLVIISTIVVNCGKRKSSSNNLDSDVYITGHWNSECVVGYNRSHQISYEFGSGEFSSITKLYDDDRCLTLKEELKLNGSYHLSQVPVSIEGQDRNAFPLDIQITGSNSEGAFNGSLFTLVGINADEIYLGEQRPNTPNNGSSEELRHNTLGQRKIILDKSVDR